MSSAKNWGQRQGDEEERQRQEDVDDEVDDLVEPAAAEAGEQADRDTDQRRGQGRHGGDGQRGAGAVEPVGEVVVAGVGGQAERCLPGEAVVGRADQREVELVEVLRGAAGPELDAEQPGEQRREDRDDDEEHHDDQARHGDLVGAEPTESDLDG
jgi:hypothetical protein